MGSIHKDFRILVADDDEDDYFLIKELIQEGIFEARCIIDRVSTLEQVLDQIQRKEYDIFLLDYRLGATDGIQILEAIHSRGIKIPIIFLTGQGDQEVAVSAMKAGANDYLVKSNLTVDTLCQSIRHSIKVYNEEIQRRKVEKALHDQGRLLQGISVATNRLLTSNDYDTGMYEALSILGEAAQVDHIFLFNDHSHPDGGEAAFSLKYVWPKTMEERGRAAFMDVSYHSLGMKAILKDLALGKTVSGLFETFPEDMKRAFQYLDPKSLILVPIKIDFIYWGFLAFADCRTFRTWSQDEDSILRTFAASLGGEIKRFRDDEAFRSIVKGTSTQMGDDFFYSLVKNLASALPARCALVGEVSNETEGACRLIAGWDGEKYIDKFQFNMTATPYEDVMAGFFTYYPDEIQKLFPGESSFKDLRARSFAGVPFFDSSMNVIGQLTVLDDRSIADRQRTASILRIFAARAGMELERKKTEDTIKNMAYYDSLTGLPNRVLLDDRLSLALEQARRHHEMLAVLFLDCDGFKKVNDTLGHSVGDMLLQEIAKRLMKCLRAQDTVARLGGDEFVLLLPEIREKANVVTLAEKLMSIAQVPFMLDGHEFRTSYSIGISLFPDDGDNAQVLLKKADEALYVAKNSGRGSFSFAAGKQDSLKED